MNRTVWGAAFALHPRPPEHERFFVPMLPQQHQAGAMGDNDSLPPLDFAGDFKSLTNFRPETPKHRHYFVPMRSDTLDLRLTSGMAQAMFAWSHLRWEQVLLLYLTDGKQNRHITGIGRRPGTQGKTYRP